jgi:hypothetical protein
LWVVHTLFWPGVWILKFSRQAKSSPSHVKLYCGKIQNNIDGIINDANFYMWQQVFPKIKVVDNISKPLSTLLTHSFLCSNNKSNGVAKTINNIFHVVEDRIQHEAIDVKHINMFYTFYGSFYQSLVTHNYDYICWHGLQELILKVLCFPFQDGMIYSR